MFTHNRTYFLPICFSICAIFLSGILSLYFGGLTLDCKSDNNYIYFIAAFIAGTVNVIGILFAIKVIHIYGGAKIYDYLFPQKEETRPPTEKTSLITPHTQQTQHTAQQTTQQTQQQQHTIIEMIL